MDGRPLGDRGVARDVVAAAGQGTASCATTSSTASTFCRCWSPPTARSPPSATTRRRLRPNLIIGGVRRSGRARVGRAAAARRRRRHRGGQPAPALHHDHLRSRHRRAGRRGPEEDPPRVRRPAGPRLRGPSPSRCWRLRQHGDDHRSRNAIKSRPRDPMSPAPIIFKTKHRIRFSDLDPYNHMSTAHYRDLLRRSPDGGSARQHRVGREGPRRSSVHGLGPAPRDRLHPAGPCGSGESQSPRSSGSFGDRTRSSNA